MSTSILYRTEIGFTLEDIRYLLLERKELQLSGDALRKVEHCYTFLDSFFGKPIASI